MADYEQEEVTASVETREINTTLDWYAVKKGSPPRPGSKITPLYCGVEVFAVIEEAVKLATSSIDFIFWGFNSSTRLLDNSDKTVWELLKEKAKANPKLEIRILLNDITNSFTILPSRILYSNITVRYRHFSVFELNNIANLAKQQGAGSFSDQQAALTAGASHHQKMVLVDCDNPPSAKGFVMGLNLAPKYRDTMDHFYDYNPEASISWQDLGCKVEGPILYDIYLHFLRAWNRVNSTNILLRSDHLSRFPVVGNQAPQFCCTQAQEGDQSILESYEKAINNAHNYIYIENQYLRYPPIAELIKKRARELQNAARANNVKAEELYIFIIMNYELEKIPVIGMDINAMNTYATLAGLGQQQLMPGIQQSLSTYDPDAWLKLVYISQQDKDRVLTPEDKKHIEGVDDVKDLTDPEKYDIDGQNGQKPFELHEIPGLKVIVGTLNTDSSKRKVSSKTHSATKVEYRGIVVHSKLLIVDDLFTSVGSANMNIRSFVTDSEANVSIPDNKLAYDMRTKLWKAHTTASIDNADLTSSAAIKCDALENFKFWNITMNKNWKLKQQGQALIGHLVRFWDDTSTDLYIFD